MTKRLTAIFLAVALIFSAAFCAPATAASEITDPVERGFYRFVDKLLDFLVNGISSLIVEPGYLVDKDDYVSENFYEGLSADEFLSTPAADAKWSIGYANASKAPFARPFIKYTPTWMRSFTPSQQSERNKIAKMKQIPVKELIEGKKLLFVDDSIVRGTQLKGTVDFLYEHGAKEVHMRSACPPIMYGCKYLNFSRATDDLELIARRTILELEGEEGFNYIEEYSSSTTERGKKLRRAIAEKFHFDSLEFQSLEGAVKAIGIDPCKLCTYCWNGKE